DEAHHAARRSARRAVDARSAARHGGAPERGVGRLPRGLLGGVSDAEHEAFVARLGALGYREPRLALSRWLDELSRVLAAAEATRRAPALRPVAEIQAELRTLPTVPLDAAGAAERDRLVEELALASVPAGARAAAEAAAGRIAALQARAGIGGGP
ncbi:MAG TPA: hypothetical protein VMM59_05435, partial [Thermohalobaculum sp.]|nr:hypothetical protein [Thermohalobaculum sp.]